MNSYPENNNLQCKIVRKTTEMDKNWQPKKTTVVKTIVKVVDGISSSEVLEAMQIEDGVTKDIKQEIIQPNKKQTGLIFGKKAEQKGQKRTENEFDGLIPFNEKRRAKFEFKRLNDDAINERAVFII
jgi:hypothetical protein